uniref:Uncharacterized protein n=1 Tax=Arundo donax TaxID=35708 RepID=A0A0A9EG37_ARUDO
MLIRMSNLHNDLENPLIIKQA